jgi:hypothetical protein
MEQSYNSLEAIEQTIESAMKNRKGDKLANIEKEVLEHAPFPTPPIPVISREGDTEYLLNGVIAEMHFIMRGLALPTAAAASDSDMRRSYIASSIDLALAAAKVGKTVAGLRSSSASRASRQTTETVEVIGAAPKNC